MNRFYDIAVIEPTASADTRSSDDVGLSAPIDALAASTSAPLLRGSLEQGTTIRTPIISEVDIVWQTSEGHQVFVETKLEAPRIRLSRPQIGALHILVADRVTLADTLAVSISPSPAQMMSHSTVIPARETVAPIAHHDVEVDMRLIPPPVEYRKIAVRFRFVGKDEPRVFYDPERD